MKGFHIDNDRHVSFCHQNIEENMNLYEKVHRNITPQIMMTQQYMWILMM